LLNICTKEAMIGLYYINEKVGLGVLLSKKPDPPLHVASPLIFVHFSN
jgi:hypothetical protein